jgi:hypothetical protein
MAQVQGRLVHTAARLLGWSCEYLSTAAALASVEPLQKNW